MKKYKSIGKLLAISLLTTTIASTCTGDAMDRINESPNNPLDAPAKFLITDLGVSTAFSTVGGDFSLYSSVHIEHETGIFNQLYRAEVRSGESATVTTYSNAWISMYSNIKNAEIVIKKCEEDPSEEGSVMAEVIAKILFAYNGAVVADVLGNILHSQTGILNPDGTPVYVQPKMDTQESIYQEVMQNLDDAITLLSSGTAKDTGLSGAVGFKDLIYDPNINAQVGMQLKTAYALKARYIVRLLNKSASKVIDLQNILTYVSRSLADASKECKLAVYDTDSQLNPFWSFNYNRSSLVASASLIERSVEHNDPRAPQVFLGPDPIEYITYGYGATQAAGVAGIKAAPNGTPQELQNSYGMSMISWAMSAPTPLIGYHEVKFLEAEALCRLGGELSEAKTALKDVVIAGFENLGNSIIDAVDTWIYDGDSDLGVDVVGAYLTDEVESLFSVNPLQETVIQKYLAFFGASDESPEVYNDYRRLKGAGGNFVMLKNPRNNSKFPSCFGYRADDILVNPGVKAALGDGQYVYNEAVWWAGGNG